ncbi:hypothetical protein O181_087243 [Austropuccinia psidii MF-1]|uniref:Uncharacterized protein n=1 Tax=Austropuccinia psidii MF-1 TaxID=1389203 RepID=A0A9Q3IPA7_9BASI|nr:hypothetical protein [Austropuccinia psidii MF-1]
MGPNISLKTPIASSMNVSGLNIDVGNAISQTSSTWSIPNISVTPIPPNPTNTQMHVSEGPGSIPEIPSKINPQSKFPRYFPLILGRIRWHKWVDGGWKKRALENVTLSEALDGNLGLNLHQNIEPKGKTVQSQEPIEDCETGHARSSREKFVDDEDENMSMTQSETNDEPRGGDFTVHEQGTQSNSEFTHPQMPLSQSMLDQFKIRQQRNQAFKAHNMVKYTSQKE